MFEFLTEGPVVLVRHWLAFLIFVVLLFFSFFVGNFLVDIFVVAIFLVTDLMCDRMFIFRESIIYLKEI